MKRIYRPVRRISCLLAMSALIFAGSAQAGSATPASSSNTGPKPLTTVAHDATLTGQGTVSSPLGVAPGASGGRALKFVDSQNKTLGLYLRQPGGGNGAALTVGGYTFSLIMNDDGSGYAEEDWNQSFTTSDCSGTPYMQWSILTFYPGVSLNTVHFPGGPPVSINVLSYISFHANNGAPYADPCQLNSTPMLAAPASTFDLSTLGLVPPFHVSQ